MYSQDDEAKLAQLHPDLRLVFERIEPTFAHDVLETERELAQQQKNVDNGVSKTLKSKHLREFSHDSDHGVDAIDVAPKPLRWPKRPSVVTKALLPLIWPWVKDLCRWYYWGGYVLGASDQMWVNGQINCRFRWGGDWDSDRDVSDQTFDDLAHFERRTDA